MKKTFLSSIHERRSVYSITNTSPIPKNKIAADRNAVGGCSFGL